jgi:predicted metal-dependent peptidase
MIEIELKNCDVKIENGVKEMLLSPYLRFFGEFLLFINFIKSESCPTMGVNVGLNALNLYYNTEFLNSINTQQIKFVLCHEVYHLISNHVQRTIAYGHDHKLSNIAQDCIINSLIKEDNELMQDLQLLDDMGILYMPPEYTGDKIYEPLYDWLLEKKNEYLNNIGDSDGGTKKNSKRQGSNDSNDSDNLDDPDGGTKKNSKKQGSNSSNKNKSEEMKNIEKYFKNDEEYVFDQHFFDNVPYEIRESFIKNIIDALKNRGLVTDNIKMSIEKLKSSKKNYLKLIETAVRSLVGIQKYKTFRKPNRKNIEGLKGRKKEEKILNVILDTSGSMCGLFDKVLSYIFHNNIIINLIQCDTEIKKFLVIVNKNKLSSMGIEGLGGTTLQPGFDFIKSNRSLKNYNTLVLTDGYCDNIDNTNMRKILVLTTSEQVQFNHPETVKQIKIDQDVQTGDKNIFLFKKIILY